MTISRCTTQPSFQVCSDSSHMWTHYDLADPQKTSNFSPSDDQEQIQLQSHHLSHGLVQCYNSELGNGAIRSWNEFSMAYRRMIENLFSPSLNRSVRHGKGMYFWTSRPTQRNIVTQSSSQSWASPPGRYLNCALAKYGEQVSSDSF